MRRIDSFVMPLYELLAPKVLVTFPKTEGVGYFWREVYIGRLLLGCISNLREIGEIILDLLNFKDMGYKCVVTNKVVNVASDIASPYQFLKQSDNYSCFFFAFSRLGIQCHLAAIAVVLSLEEYTNSIAKNPLTYSCPSSLVLFHTCIQLEGTR